MTSDVSPNIIVVECGRSIFDVVGTPYVETDPRVKGSQGRRRPPPSSQRVEFQQRVKPYPLGSA